MNTSRPLDASVCDAAWQITLGAIEKAALMGRCQLRGAVVVLEPEMGRTIFIGDINQGTDAVLQAGFRRVAQQVAGTRWLHQRTGAYETLIPDVMPTKTNPNPTPNVGVTTQTAMRNRLLVTVCVTNDDHLTAIMAANMMMSAIEMELDVVLDRRPPEDDEDDAPTAVLSRVQRTRTTGAGL